MKYVEDFNHKATEKFVWKVRKNYPKIANIVLSVLYYFVKVNMGKVHFSYKRVATATDYGYNYERLLHTVA